tara:strand:+ start:875 stop:1147 length:273 start_codon:yes stop_codon:yes gene_type:complete
VFQYLFAELAFELMLSLIPEKIRRVIGALIMGLGGVLMALGGIIITTISDGLANLLGAIVLVIGLFISMIGYSIRKTRVELPSNIIEIVT